MNEERAKASFDIRALTLLMDGGQKQTDVIYWNAIDNYKILITPEFIIVERKNYARISRKLGICPPSLPDHLAVSNLAQAVQQLAIECKAPIKLNSFGIQEEAALSAEDVIANNALNDTTFKTNPIQFSAEEIKDIYRNIIK